jgi:hypothetical protein
LAQGLVQPLDAGMIDGPGPDRTPEGDDPGMAHTHVASP